MQKLLDRFNFRKLNSATKYPSIPTYHEIVGGLLQDNLTPGVDFIGDVELREKIDGENTRIVFYGDGTNVDFIIGSREEFLYAMGDRIGDSKGNIANNIRGEALRLADELKGMSGLLVLYYETYGGKTPNAKNYTTDHSQSIRLFDIMTMAEDELENLIHEPLEKIASWREHGGQSFAHTDQRDIFCKKYRIGRAPLITVRAADTMPLSHEETYNFLKQYEVTLVGINDSGHSEGLVARTSDRKVIAKLRFEDYERTFKKKPRK